MKSKDNRDLQQPQRKMYLWQCIVSDTVRITWYTILLCLDVKLFCYFLIIASGIHATVKLKRLISGITQIYTYVSIHTGCYDRTHIRQQKMSDHVKTLHEASGWVWHWPLTSLKTIWGLAPRENGPGGKGVIFMLCWKASLSLAISCTPSGKKDNKSDGILETGESFVLLLLSEVFLCCVSQTLKKYSYIWVNLIPPLPSHPINK